MKETNSFRRGIMEGLPIAIGYLSVSFAFGIFAVQCGLYPLEALLISMTNLTRFESDQKKIDTGIGRPKCFGYMGKNKFPNTFCNGDYL